MIPHTFEIKSDEKCNCSRSVIINVVYLISFLGTMDKYENMGGVPEQQSLRFFTWWVLLAQVFGLTAVILTAVWMGHFRGGFAWQSDLDKEFNYHPLFMIIGMVFLYGNGDNLIAF